ncbi:hypothetical protein VS_1555 [Vibrio atlanticus]|uniref:Uncharacterized protein n=1 Tax=Vibrio atlanticus (strain LGP32) TaxID=575788 RepID=B7VNZ2_VIBA3|nr:hypothetical protein VS_1555 [Vibrio atlanticus]
MGAKPNPSMFIDKRPRTKNTLDISVTDLLRDDEPISNPLYITKERIILRTFYAYFEILNKCNSL